jgi:hypothetical protein
VKSVLISALIVICSGSVFAASRTGCDRAMTRKGPSVRQWANIARSKPVSTYKLNDGQVVISSQLTNGIVVWTERNGGNSVTQGKSYELDTFIAAPWDLKNAKKIDSRSVTYNDQGFTPLRVFKARFGIMILVGAKSEFWVNADMQVSERYVQNSLLALNGWGPPRITGSVDRDVGFIADSIEVPNFNEGYEIEVRKFPISGINSYNIRTAQFVSQQRIGLFAEYDRFAAVQYDSRGKIIKTATANMSDYGVVRNILLNDGTHYGFVVVGAAGLFFLTL